MVMGSNPIKCAFKLKLMLSIENLLIYILMFPIFGILLLCMPLLFINTV